MTDVAAGGRNDSRFPVEGRKDEIKQAPAGWNAGGCLFLILFLVQFGGGTGEYSLFTGQFGGFIGQIWKFTGQFSLPIGQIPTLIGQSLN
ncbi:hypothetical protein D1B31_13445 [Neobacillus notoginsengisoli]|uniref:Uncharacterized protein n=2 Tax=Neobacillus notoginsengisoli TaxID=1578198 RepID=A0A417YSK6_9BACI|nr:hypothetical protein D1B31_13445 [Neobacillus notoginsengisoli]